MTGFETFLPALLGVIIVSAIPLIGFAVVFVSKPKLEQYTHLLVSFAIGALLGNAFMHLLPEIFSESKNTTVTSIAIVSGILIFYCVEQFLKWHHTHNETTQKKAHAVAYMSMIGDTVHNALDGLLIASSFIISSHLGWITVFAVILHEIPQEIGDFSLLLYAKWPIPKIIWVNLLSAASAFIGLGLGYVLSSQITGFAQLSAAVTTGGFIYIACSDLIPDLHENGASQMKERLLQLLVICLGIGLFIIL